MTQSVLISGGGIVGSYLGLELAARNIPFQIIEKSHPKQTINRYQNNSWIACKKPAPNVETNWVLEIGSSEVPERTSPNFKNGKNKMILKLISSWV